MLISNDSIGECSIVNCLYYQYYHCLYSDKDVDYVASGGINSIHGIRSGSVLNNREWKELERLKSKRNLNAHEKKLACEN